MYMAGMFQFAGRQFPAFLSFPCAILMLLATAAQSADRFVSGIVDLPLMPGLEEIDGSAMVFSKPQGRIVEVSARGAVTSDAVRFFYGRTLPQLGWRPRQNGGWQRDNEVLQFNMKQTNAGLVIEYSLTPQ